MHKHGGAVVKGVLVVGALVLASLPVSAQFISVDTVKSGHFPEALRGHLDGRPNKSGHRLSTAGFAAAALARPTNPPQPIVSPFFRTSSRIGSVNYGFVVGANPFFGDDDARSASVKTFIVPIVIKVHQVATDFSVDANDNLILTGIKDRSEEHTSE